MKEAFAAQREFTILMPCLNEAQALPFCIAEAKAAIAELGLDAEILIADNGSVDRSAEIALSLGARVAKAPRRGYGAALIAGIGEARGRCIIMGDADGSYDFSAIGPFVEALREGCALVVGDRFALPMEKGAMPLSHRLGVPLLSALARLRFHTDVRDFHCGLRGFERDKALALGLSCPGMEFATELIARFAQSGADIAQRPARLRRDKRGGGRPHLRTLRDGLRHLYYILFAKAPGKGLQ